MGEFGIGQPVRRKEDMRLLRGGGRYTDDVNVDGQLWAAFVRSPHAHARIDGIDLAAARMVPGVAGILTGADVASDALGTLLCEADIKSRDGKSLFKPVRPVLPADAVRYVGQPVALVIADTPEHARDAAEIVNIDYRELPSVTATDQALAPTAALVWPENKSNLCVHWENEDASRWDAARAKAHTVVTVDLVNNRLIASPMEPRAIVVDIDAATGKLTVYAPTQGGRRIQNTLAKAIFRIAPDMIRSISYDVGGGFGVRSKVSPETVALAYAARKLKRPVKWRGDRSETFVSDTHGRDQINTASLALDADGKILAMKVETVLNLGAYLSDNGPRLPITGPGKILCGAYDIPALYYSVKPVFTNTVPTDTYRGAGRPEANYIHERLMEAAAEALGLSSVEIRRRNLVPAAKLPYTTQLGMTIDSGDFIGTVDKAVKAADWDGFEARRKNAQGRGRLRGIGMAFFIESAGGRPMEEMKLRIARDGKIEIFSGTFSHGQGHDTVYSQLMNEYLGVPLEDVRLIQGDTDTMPENAVGTFGSRSSMMGGVPLKRMAAALIEKGKAIAGHLLQAEPGEVTFTDGAFRARASSVTLAEVARAAHDPSKRPDGMPTGLEEKLVYKRKNEDDQNFPNGCHIAEVEVDPDTGAIEVVAFTAVDDCGTILNPFIVHGQMHGGIAQGLGQALLENVAYDPESGQLLAGSYMDYAMPRAIHLPRMDLGFNEVPSVTNDLGVKGCGEAGSCGAPPAIVHAVIDALKGLGVRHLDMPLASEKVWRAIRNGRSKAA
jgi:aerobic carbon-monoxide dehydrogenase large subunit